MKNVNYMLLFWVVIAFLMGRCSTIPVYMGYDEQKYQENQKKNGIGVLWSKEKKENE